ncbi:MAG: MFS transporter, partial [Lentisphaerae bacterium]|nr:MFS transporter [Lentisphaerota bacterium]
PMALGPILGGWAIARYGEVPGIRIAFGIAFVLGLVSIGVVKVLMPDDTPSKAASYSVWGMARHIRGPLRVLLIADILIRFAEQIPYAFVVIWVMANNGLSAPQFGVLTAIEMATAMIVYIPVAYFADKHRKKPFVVMTFAFFTLFPLTLMFSTTFPALALAFIVRGLKEFGEPTRKALIMDLAPDDAKAGAFGTYYLIRDLVVAAGALASAPLWTISPQANFMAAFVCGLAGTALFAAFGSDRIDSREGHTPCDRPATG